MLALANDMLAPANERRPPTPGARGAAGAGVGRESITGGAPSRRDTGWPSMDGSFGAGLSLAGIPDGGLSLDDGRRLGPALAIGEQRDMPKGSAPNSTASSRVSFCCRIYPSGGSCGPIVGPPWWSSSLCLFLAAAARSSIAAAFEGLTVHLLVSGDRDASPHADSGAAAWGGNPPSAATQSRLFAPVSDALVSAAPLSVSPAAAASDEGVIVSAADAPARVHHHRIQAVRGTVRL
eukprot:CAMPEP_0181394748 /NCGR_PEP_ID=MMETSP1106-20121128/27940_1 /TAXON_ID=81844 /ORGANISM="Mantoniella antarctica, Strain SL-175" /LENGTH=235 /DNA_ID=CAMNT_0023516259 /DNA_START=343 /DNA_END=1051 /DNA_ORIENTATION=-